MPMPKDVKQVRALMGGINYYSYFLPDLSKRRRHLLDDYVETQSIPWQVC